MFLYPGLFMKAWRLRVEHSTIGSEPWVDFSMSTFDTITSFWSSNSEVTAFSVVAGLVFFFFSVVVPHLKLGLILHSLLGRRAIAVGEDEYIDLRRVVRSISKFQLIDMYFVTILCAALPNAFVNFDILPGFYSFFLYCVLSILGAMLVDSNPYMVESLELPDDRQKIIVTSMGCIFSACIFWALFLPVFRIRYLYDDVIAIYDVDESLISIFWRLAISGHWLLAVFSTFSILILPVLRLARGLRVFWVGGDFKGQFGDYAHLDVYAVSLATVFLVINSLSFLNPALEKVGPKVSVTWGLLSAVVAGFSFGEISAKLSPPVITPHHEEIEDVPINWNSFGKKISKGFTLPLFIAKMFISVLLLSVWFFRKVAPPISIAELNALFSKNLEIFTSGLHAVIGKFSDRNDIVTYHGEPLFRTCLNLSGAMIDCAGSGFKTIEIIIQHVRGLNTSHLTNVTMSYENGVTTLGVTGFLRKFATAFYIGRCFSSRHFHTRCPQLYSREYEVENVNATMEFTANCSRTRPFVRDIMMSQLNVLSPVQLQLPLGLHRLLDHFGFPSRIDKNNLVKEGLMYVGQSWLDYKESWIPLGDDLYTASQLVNHIAKMNTPGDKGVFPWCPEYSAANRVR